VVLHAPYLVNLGSPTPLTFERSVASVAANLRRAREIGAEALVVHTGSCVDDGGYDAALAQVRSGLMPLLDGLDDTGPWLLLEPTAGQGRSLCGTVAELEPYLQALDRHPRAGVCLDTCHAFAAGEPLDEPGGTTDTVDRLVAVAGPGRLRLVHANDSKDGRGAMKDRHERIGEGRIGLGAFEELFAHPALDGVPFVLETPGAREVGDQGLPLLRRLREESAARAVRAAS
jgi:deoxyribonuclease-4